MPNEFIFYIIFMIAFVGVMVFLHLNGLLDFIAKAAVKFIRERSKNGEKFSMTSCTGTVSRFLKFADDGKYEFTLDSDFEKGSAEVTLFDRQKAEVVRLDGECKSAVAFVNEGERYFLKWKFKSVSGECELKWDRKSGS